jgi:hypothetical protein
MHRDCIGAVNDELVSEQTRQQLTVTSGRCSRLCYEAEEVPKGLENGLPSVPLGIGELVAIAEAWRAILLPLLG